MFASRLFYISPTHQLVEIEKKIHLICIILQLKRKYSSTSFVRSLFQAVTSRLRPIHTKRLHFRSMWNCYLLYTNADFTCEHQHLSPSTPFLKMKTLRMFTPLGLEYIWWHRCPCTGDSTVLKEKWHQIKEWLKKGL